MGLVNTKKWYQNVLNHNAVEINENDLDTSNKLISRKPSVKSTVCSEKFETTIKNYFKLSSEVEDYIKNKPISRFGLCRRLNKMMLAKQFINLQTSKDPAGYLGNYKHKLNQKTAKNDAVHAFEDQPKKSKNGSRNITDIETKKFSLVKSPFKKIKQEDDRVKIKSPSVRDALKKGNLRLKKNPQKAIRCAHRNFQRAIININALSKRLAARPPTPPKIENEAVYYECSDSVSLETPTDNVNMECHQNDSINLNIEEIKSTEEDVDVKKSIKNNDPETKVAVEKKVKNENVGETVNLAKQPIPEKSLATGNKVECQVTDKIVPELKLTYSNSNMSITSSCTTPSDTAKACVKYRKTAQQALSQLNDQVSSVLRNSLCSIDDIRQRVHSTVTEINENELKYQYLKAHPNACTVRNSEPNQNVNELDVQPPVAKTKSENPLINHSREIEVKVSFEELYDDESKASVAIPASKCQAMSTLPKIVSLGELLNLTPSKSEQKAESPPESPPENITKTDTAKNVKEKEKVDDDITKTCLLRIEAHRDLHTILVQELKEAENENCLEPQKNKTKHSIKRKSTASVHITAEELYVPEKQINKIPANSEVLAENTISLSSPQCHLSKENKKNNKLVALCTKSKSLLNGNNNENSDKTLKKYSDSLWFSNKTKKKIKMTKEVVQSKDGSETVMKLAASKSSVVIENTVVQTDDTIKPPKKCNILSVNYKNRLNCFDILDEITLSDLKPIEPEYPRKDHIGTNQCSIKVEKTFLYKLVYACSNQYFMEMINVQVPLPNCTFPNCLLCRSAYQSLRNGNKYCQTEQAGRSTAIVRRDAVMPNSSKVVRANQVKPKSRSASPVATKKIRVENDSKKLKTKKEDPKEDVPEIKTGKKTKEKAKLPPKSPKKKRKRRNTIAESEVITEKLRPYMLDPSIRYNKSVVVAQTTLVNNKTFNTPNTARREVLAKLRPYIFDLEDRHFKTYTIMPVFVSTYKAQPVEKNFKSKQTPLEVKEKLRPYIMDPNENSFSAMKLKSKPSNSTNNQNPSKHVIKTSSSDFETQRSKRRYSKTSKTSSRLSFASSSSSDVGKLQSYMCDNSLKYPNIVTAMPATVKTFENLTFDKSSTSAKMQKCNSGDYPLQGPYKITSNTSAKSPFSKAQFKSSVSFQKNDNLPKARTNAASNLMSFLAKQNLIEPQHSFGDNLRDYLHQKPTQIVGLALTSTKNPKKSVSSKLDQVVHPQSPNLTTKSQNLAISSNETVRPATPKTQTRVRRKSIIPRTASLQKPQKELEKLSSNKNVLENNIQNVIEMIETKIIDIISSPDKTHSETFNNVEQEIIQILDTIRQVEPKPLNTIEECADAKGSQAEVNVLHNKGKNYQLLTPNDSSTLRTKSELSKKDAKFFQFEPKKKFKDFETTSANSANDSHFFTDVNSSVEKLERTVDYLEADQQQYQAPTKSETLKNLATKSYKKPSIAKISKSEKSKQIDEVQKIIEKRVESINEIINELNKQELDRDQDIENKLKTIQTISTISLTDTSPSVSKLEEKENKEQDLISDEIPQISDEIPQISDEIPIISDEIPIISDELPIISDEIPIISDQIPIISDQIPIIADQIPNETSNPKTDGIEKVVEKLYVNDGKIQDMCDKEVSTTTLDHDLAINEAGNDNKIEKCNSSYYLTPFMKALIKYRSEDTTKSNSILDFLDTLNTISNDNPIIQKLAKLNFKQKITISEILQTKKIYYPAEIYHPISVYSNDTEKTEERWLLSLFGNLRKCLRRKPIESNENDDTPKICSIENNVCLIEPPENVSLNLIEIEDSMYDNKQHGSFLNSLYSALFAAVFFSFTLNYSCH